MGSHDQPSVSVPVVLATPQLGLQATTAAARSGDRDDQGMLGSRRDHADVEDVPRRCTASDPAVGSDLVVAHQQARRVTAERAGAWCEQAVHRREVVGHEGALIGPERLEEPLRHRSKSAFRIRACTPLTRSTTCEMLKSVAALR